LTLFSKEEDGRETPIGNGYRPNHVFEYEEDGALKYTFIGDFQFGENNLLEPGTTQSVTARFLTHQPIEQYLNIGQKWWIHEGPRKIGEAEMIKIELPEKE
jgi:translation elongation factor EF-Tu-like GTPase